MHWLQDVESHVVAVRGSLSESARRGHVICVHRVHFTALGTTENADTAEGDRVRDQPDLLVDELTTLGCEVVVVHDYTVSWEAPPDEIDIGSRPPI